MYEFQSYSTVEQNGDALFMATPVKTRNPKPRTPNPKRQTQISSNMPTPNRVAPSRRQPAGHHALSPSQRRGRPLTPGVPRHRPPRHTVRAPRADAPPYRQAVTFSATRAASASARSGRIFPTSRPPAAAPGVGRRRRRRRPEGGWPQRRPPPHVEEGKGEGMDMRKQRSGQGRHRSLLVDASAVFVLSGAGACLACIAAL